MSSNCPECKPDKPCHEHQRPDFLKLKAAAKTARELASELFNADATGPCRARGMNSCLKAETERLTGWPKLPAGATNRAYSMFDPAKLCTTCLPYWHIEMGAQALAHLVQLERAIAADEKRQLPDEQEQTESVKA